MTFISDKTLTEFSMAQTFEWRDIKQGHPQSIFGMAGRRLCCAVALAGLSIFGLVEAVTSLALAILTLPLQVFGYEYSGKLASRAIACLSMSVVGLTYYQLRNIYEDKVQSGLV